MTVSAFHNLSDFLAPILSQFEAGDFPEFFEIPPAIHSKSECGEFAGSGYGGQFFAGLDSALAFLKSFAIEPRVGPVFTANAIYITGSAGPHPEIVASTPIINIVPTGPSREFLERIRVVTSEIGYLILHQTGVLASIDHDIVHSAYAILVHIDLARAHLLEKGCVFLVCDFIAG